MKYNLADKAILIIDDHAAMRKTLRDMLNGLGATKVFEVDNGMNAISAIQKRKFDIVFCDQNLGVGKNGQQVLEEARHRKLLGHQCIFFMITAEHNIKKVLGVMDSKPDEYLAKPFNAQQISRRLQRHFSRKHFLAEIDKEIDRGNLSKAITLLDHSLLENDPDMHMILQKKRAELAIHVGDFNTAKDLYNQILAERELSWARLGLGIIDFHQNFYDRAINTFEQLIRDQPTFMEAYDWLCKAYESLQLLEEAQTTLHQAVEMLPQSILRQKKLAEVAEKNGHFGIAKQAYKTVLNLGVHSVHKSCTDFSGLAKVYAKTNDVESAFKTLQIMRDQFKNNSEAELWSATIAADLYQKQGVVELSTKAMQKALSLSARLGNTIPKELQLDLVKTCFLTNHNAQGDKLLANLIKSTIDDDVFLNDLRRMLTSIGKEDHSEVLITKTKKQLIAINNQGVALFQKGKFQEALAFFEQAIEHLPDNKTILVNMIKVLIQDLMVNGNNQEKSVKARNLIRDAENIGVDSQKLENLKMQLTNIQNGHS